MCEFVNVQYTTESAVINNSLDTFWIVSINSTTNWGHSQPTSHPGGQPTNQQYSSPAETPEQPALTLDSTQVRDRYYQFNCLYGLAGWLPPIPMCFGISSRLHNRAIQSVSHLPDTAAAASKWISDYHSKFGDYFHWFDSSDRPSIRYDYTPRPINRRRSNSKRSTNVYLYPLSTTWSTADWYG